MNKDSERSENDISIFEPIQSLENDRLGRFRFASTLMDRIMEPDCSRTIGIYGSWGVGKTSILNLMMAMNDQKNIPIIEKPLIKYMDVWPYEVSGDLALPIIVQTRSLIGAQPLASYSKSWRRILGVLAQAGADIALRRAL
jgi:hypothetical protein